MKAIILALIMMFSLSGLAKPPKAGATQPTMSDELPIKKSKAGICRPPGSTYYKKTNHFTPFKTLDECLTSGGRTPKKKR